VLFSTDDHLETFETELTNMETASAIPDWYEKILSSYIGPRIVLTIAASIYATNFPLGAIMDDNLPPSAATMGRMIVAALALSPFLRLLEPQLRFPAILSGLFSGIAYVTQSAALVNTNPARVSFLGAATVLWVPVLEAFIDKRPMGLRQAPETWLAALLCFTGVGVLEFQHQFGGGTMLLSVSSGDILALVQAIGFGTSCFINNKVLRDHNDQALPLTATLILTTAILSIFWSLADGWIVEPDFFHYTLPGMIVTPELHAVAGAVLWTGLISTSFNYSLELTALGRVPASEAAVILASEPLWAALFGALLYHTGLSSSDAIGGLLIVAACVVNATLKPAHFGCPPRHGKEEEVPLDEPQKEDIR
jgi:drug/metabolite transporter (DMT)-like permease